MTNFAVVLQKLKMGVDSLSLEWPLASGESSIFRGAGDLGGISSSAPIALSFCSSSSDDGRVETSRLLDDFDKSNGSFCDCDDVHVD